MSKKDLLDLSLFDEAQRKSEMTIKRPQLVRRSDPSVYDKQPQPEPMALKELSKCNYFTTAPEYEYRKFSQVSLEEPTALDYFLGLFFIVVWMFSNSTILPACQILQGDVVHRATQFIVIRIVVSLLKGAADRSQPFTLQKARAKQYLEAVIWYFLVAITTMILVERIQLNFISLVLNADSVIVAILAKQKAGLAGLLVLPCLLSVPLGSMLLALLTMLLMVRIQFLELKAAEEALSLSLTLVVLLVISLFNSPLLQINMWTFMALCIFGTNQLISMKFPQLANKHYINESFSFSLLKFSTVALAIWESAYDQTTYFILLCIAIVGEVVCQFANKQSKHESDTMSGL